MSEHEEDPILIAVATTIADGHPVDWESLIAEHAEVAEDLRGLRLLQEVRAAQESARREEMGR